MSGTASATPNARSGRDRKATTAVSSANRNNQNRKNCGCCGKPEAAADLSI
jgi:hypothetical protein